MFGPDWEEGCTGCSFGADHIDGAMQHLVHHDVSLCCGLSRAACEAPRLSAAHGLEISLGVVARQRFQFRLQCLVHARAARAGQGAYNFEMIETQMDELPGCSVFYKDEGGNVFHTYSSYGRGNEEVIGAYMLLDMTPKGRNETGSQRQSHGLDQAPRPVRGRLGAAAARERKSHAA